MRRGARYPNLYAARAGGPAAPLNDARASGVRGTNDMRSGAVHQHFRGRVQARREITLRAAVGQCALGYVAFNEPRATWHQPIQLVTDYLDVDGT